MNTRQLYFDQIPAPDPRSVQTWSPRAMPMPPGTGPEGQTCGTCLHCYSHKPGNRRFFKCDLMVCTHGPATDIKLKMPACGRWEAVE